MNKRKLIISLAGVVILVGGIALSGALSKGKPKPAEAAPETAATVVRTVTVKNDTIQADIKITGRVIPAERVEVYAEVTGVSRYGSRPFKAGNSFRRGQVLLRINSSELGSALAAAKSQFMSTLANAMPDLKLDYNEAYPKWETYLTKLSVDKPIPPLPKVTDKQLKLFLAGRNIYSSYYSITETETRLAKYTIRAPFNGTLTESNISGGTLVRSGQLLGEFIKDDVFELEGAVRFQQLEFLKKGQHITFKDVNADAEYTGTLVRINEKVDPTTQLVKVYIQLKDPKLRSGLYLEGTIAASTVTDAMKLPIQALVDNQFVFAVNEGKAVKQDVTIAAQDADSFIAQGLENGATVVIDKKNSAFEGSNVIITE